MAMVIAAGETKVTRGDVHFIDPSEVVVNWKANISRAGAEIAVDEKLQELALSMLPKGPIDGEDNGSGQINAVLGRLLPDRRVEIVGGFRRTRAALWLKESGKAPDFKLMVKVVKCSDDEAALMNMDENLQREDPEPIQYAYAIRTLNENYGHSIDSIAKRLKKSVPWVHQKLQLLKVAEPIKVAVTAGEVSEEGARVLAKLPEPEQIEAFNAAKSANAGTNPKTGKPQTVKAQDVKDAVNKIVEAKSTANGGKLPEGQKFERPSIKRVDKFMEDLISRERSKPNGGNKFITALANDLSCYINGSMTADRLVKSFAKCCKDMPTA